MAVDIAFMFVVAICRAEDRWTDTACEVLNVVFAIKRSDVGTS